MLPQHMASAHTTPEWALVQQALVFTDFVHFWSVLLLHCRTRVAWRWLLPPPATPLRP